MDTIGHALWSFILFNKHPKKWWAVFFGVFPDLFSIIPHMTIEHYMGTGQALFDTAYKTTHSILIFGIISIILYFIVKDYIIVLGAWLIHIIIDIVTHPASYYPTPFLYPFTSPTFTLLDYRTKTFIFINHTIITSILIGMYILRKRETNR